MQPAAWREPAIVEYPAHGLQARRALLFQGKLRVDPLVVAFGIEPGRRFPERLRLTEQLISLCEQRLGLADNGSG